MPDELGPKISGTFKPGAPKPTQDVPVDKSFAQPGSFVGKDKLAEIGAAIPAVVESTPRCGNCPMRARAPQLNQLQCRAEPPKLFMMTGAGTMAGQVQVQFLAQYPPTTEGEVCGKHPILAARVAAITRYEEGKAYDKLWADGQNRLG